MVITDDAKMAGRLSTLLAGPSGYLSVVDAPRMQRPDANAEVIRRTNVAARIKPKIIALAGLDRPSVTALSEHLPAKRLFEVADHSDLDRLAAAYPERAIVEWGNNNIGLGVLTALQSRAQIVFRDQPSPEITNVLGRSKHIVICEGGNDLSEVIASNYAHSLRAGMVMIPAQSKQYANRILERFYSLYAQEEGPSAALAGLAKELRDICGDFPMPSGTSLSFFTSGLPYGVAFPELPSTHLFVYPDLGTCIANGFASEQRDGHGIQSAVLVDPGTTDAPEISELTQVLKERRCLVRVYGGAGATVRNVRNAVEHFPYDLLLIATHCGDSPGYRWTYQFVDSDGKTRNLVVDISIGIAATDDPEMLSVTQRDHFRSLDGVDWGDVDRDSKLVVGSAITSYLEQVRNDKLEPVRKEEIERVVGGRALRMADHNYIPIPNSLFSKRNPIIINNACVSWDELASSFLFSGASSYVGTLIEVTPFEASDIVTRAIRDNYGKTLAHAFWAAQRRAYAGSQRRPYVVSGVYTRKIRTSHGDVPAILARELAEEAASWEKMRKKAANGGDRMLNHISEVSEYLNRELGHFRSKY